MNGLYWRIHPLLWLFLCVIYLHCHVLFDITNAMLQLNLLTLRVVQARWEQLEYLC